MNRLSFQYVRIYISVVSYLLFCVTTHLQLDVLSVLQQTNDFSNSEYILSPFDDQIVWPHYNYP